MHKPQVAIPCPHRRTIPGLFLLTNWFAGLSLGFLAARFHGGMLAELLYRAASVPGSFFGSLIAAMLPLFLSACAVMLFDPRWIYPICLARSVCLGLMLGAVTLCCSGGGLLGLLLLFPALFSCPVLLWYWLRQCCGFGAAGADALRAFALTMAIWGLDRWLIAPFLAQAMNF